MRIAVCDDNPIVSEKIGFMLEEYAELRGLFLNYDIFGSYEELDECLDHYDIFILDYNMNDYARDDNAEDKLDGMAFAKKIRRHTNPEKAIIFITAYPDFVYQAFEVRTHRFIVKPVTNEKLYEALDNYIVDNSIANKIVIKSGKETYILHSSDIIYIDSIKKDTFIHLKNNTIKCHKRLTEFEKELESMGFLRIHRSYLINVSKVDTFDYNEAIMINGDTVYISKSKYSELCKKYCE